MGKLPPGTLGGPNFGSFITTPSGYVDPLNPQPGPFAKSWTDDRDVPTLGISAGIYGFPVLFYKDVNVIATVA